MSLGELFSDEFKAGFAERNVTIGSVIRVFVADTIPPKEKRLILVGASYDKLFFASIFINTEVNPNIFHTQVLVDLNLELLALEREYLSHDSYADCSEIRKRDAQWLYDLVVGDPTRVLGKVSADDLRQIRARIKSAKTISPAMKKTFGLFL